MYMLCRRTGTTTRATTGNNATQLSERVAARPRSCLCIKSASRTHQPRPPMPHRFRWSAPSDHSRANWKRRGRHCRYLRLRTNNLRAHRVYTFVCQLALNVGQELVHARASRGSHVCHAKGSDGIKRLLALENDQINICDRCQRECVRKGALV